MSNLFNLLQYLGFKFVSGLLYSFTLVYFYSTESIVDNFYLLIIQEFYFSFFLTYYRVNMVGKSKSFSLYGLLILSSLVLFSVYYNLDSPLDGIILMGSTIAFPFYLLFASCLEKQDFTKAIRVENISALSSVIFFFLVSLIFNLFDIRWIGFIYLRFFIFFIIVILYFIRYQYKKDYFKEVVMPRKTSLKEFLSLTIIFLLMIFKFRIVNEGVLSTDYSKLDTKIFLFLYDFLAAIYGFYLRYIVAQKNTFRGIQKLTLLVFGFLSFSAVLIILFYFSNSVLSEEVIFTLFSSFALAASFGIFVLNTDKKINFIYASILIVLIFFTKDLGLKNTTIYYFLSIILLILYLNYKPKKSIFKSRNF